MPETLGMTWHVLAQQPDGSWRAVKVSGELSAEKAREVAKQLMWLSDVEYRAWFGKVEANG